MNKRTFSTTNVGKIKSRSNNNSELLSRQVTSVLSECNSIIKNLESKTNNLSLTIKNALIKKFLKNEQMQSQYRANLNRRAVEWKAEKVEKEVNDKLKSKTGQECFDILPSDMFNHPLFKDGKLPFLNLYRFYFFLQEYISRNHEENEAKSLPSLPTVCRRTECE